MIEVPKSDTHMGSDINAQGPTFLIFKYSFNWLKQSFLTVPKNKLVLKRQWDKNEVGQSRNGFILFF